MGRHSVRCLVVYGALALASVVALTAQAVRYIHDELGRPIAVIDQNGALAVYTDDAVDNLLSIARQSAGTVSILEFTPNGGPVGASITLSGTDFSATPSQNAVTFNGTAASVQSAITTEPEDNENRDVIHRVPDLTATRSFFTEGAC